MRGHAPYQARFFIDPKPRILILNRYSVRMKKTISLESAITESQNDMRLDAAISQLFPEYSRNQLQHWIKQGDVRVNGKCEKKPRKVAQTGDIIQVEAQLAETTTYTGQDIPLTIVYEDEHIIVINKPVGLIVHPGAGNPDRTLVNALLHYSPDLNAVPRAGVVHRLDKDTSGLLVIARTLVMHNALIRAMQQRTIHREYRALVQGVMISGGTINAQMARHPNQRTKMAVVESGREAITHYRVQSRFAAHTLLSIKLETGRTHQIRVHMAHIGYPIVGDKTYEVEISSVSESATPSSSKATLIVNGVKIDSTNQGNSRKIAEDTYLSIGNNEYLSF